MPRYLFHLTDGHRSTTDFDGVELRDAEVARLEAHEMAADRLREAQVTGRDWTGWRVDVVDSDGRHIHSIPFSGLEPT
jgi:hypothetical protein